MRNIQFNNCDEIFDKQYYFYDEGKIVVAGKSLDNIHIMSKRSNYEKK